MATQGATRVLRQCPCLIETRERVHRHGRRYRFPMNALNHCVTNVRVCVIMMYAAAAVGLGVRFPNSTQS